MPKHNMVKTRIIQEGKKVKMKYCPKCKDKIMIKLKSGAVEVFQCENCKFVVKE